MELGCGELQWYNSNELVLKPNGLWRKRRSLAGGAAGWLLSSSGGEFWNQLS